jgi:hypothetical protein
MIVASDLEVMSSGSVYAAFDAVVSNDAVETVLGVAAAAVAIDRPAAVRVARAHYSLPRA